VDLVCGRVPDRRVAGPAGVPCSRTATTEDPIISMNLMETFRAKRCWILQAAGVFLLAGLTALALNLPGSARWDAGRASARLSSSFRIPAASPVPSESLEKSYLLDFAGDHSLNGATVTEQISDGHVNYTVQLRLASGAEQSVTVPGPPGGLQIEMHDMTGDHVPNDVVLRPALFSWLPTVLVNDGHDHFAVLVSGADPGNFTSPADLGSRRGSAQTFAFLRSSGFKAIQLPASKRMIVPQLRQCSPVRFTQSFAWGIEHASRLDRAPPFAASI